MSPTQHVFEQLPAWIAGLAHLFANRSIYFRNLGVFEGSLTYPNGTVERIVLYGTCDYIVTE